MVDRGWGFQPGRSWAVLALTATGLTGCWESDHHWPETAPWDTTLTVAGKAVPDPAALERAIVHPGSEGYLEGFFAKCRRGGEVRIGFIGGSITAGAGAGDLSRRYSTRLCAFLGKRFPRTRFREINAGIGSTGSRFACSRARYDLFPGEPDLIVLEFAVNDDLSDTASSSRSFEGLVRQCQARTDAPVIVYQTVNRNGDSVNHRIETAVAERYGAAVVSFREAFWPAIAEGSLPWESVAADNVHPNDTGHAAGAYLLYAFLARASTSLDASPLPAPPLPAASFYENADLMHAGDTTVTVAARGGWSQAADAKGRVRLVSPSSGGTLVLETRARELTLGFRSARAGTGKAAVRVEGALPDTLTTRQDEGVPDGTLVFKTLDGLDGGPRRVEIENLAPEAFTLEYILYVP